jgi:polyisoprenoid-binding protein YceI
LLSATVSGVTKDKFLIATKGELTIAGVTQTISMDVNALLNTDNSITCSGSEKIKLTDYGIKPPTFMLGAMKVYNDLTIQFNLIYKK